MTDEARKKILARRATFIAAALAGVGACTKDPKETPPQPCLSVPFVRPDAGPQPCLKPAAPRPEPDAEPPPSKDGGSK